MLPLGDIADWGTGGTPKRSVAEYFGGGIPWLSIADLNDGLVVDSKETLTNEGLANSSAKVVKEGAIFVAMYGSIGKLGVAARPMSTSQAIAFAQPREDVVDRRYLFQYLLSERPHLQAMGRGGTQMNIGQGDLKAWPIPLPELDEQRRIAAILDHADALRAKRRQVLAHLDGLTQAIFHEMFDSPFAARSAVLSEVAAVASGITKGRKANAPTTPTPYLAVANVQAGHLKLGTVKEIEATAAEVERYALKDGDLVLTEGGDPDKLGRGTVWRSELPMCMHQNHVFRVRPHEEVLPDYLASYLASRSARSYFRRAAKQTTGIASINMSQLRATPIRVPAIAEQRTFVDQAAAVRSQVLAVQAAVAADGELFASLQSRAFRGEL